MSNNILKGIVNVKKIRWIQKMYSLWKSGVFLVAENIFKSDWKLVFVSEVLRCVDDNSSKYLVGSVKMELLICLWSIILLEVLNGSKFSVYGGLKSIQLLDLRMTGAGFFVLALKILTV